VSDSRYRALALALPGAEEKSHFGKADFRVRNKIFAGFNDQGMAYVKLSRDQQDMLCAAEPDLISPIKGGWGAQGWTQVEHHSADAALLRSVLVMAWTNVAPKAMVKVMPQPVWPEL
jgi:hypothetical protein